MISDDGGLLGDWLVRDRPGSSISNQVFLFFCLFILIWAAGHGFIAISEIPGIYRL